MVIVKQKTELEKNYPFSASEYSTTFSYRQLNRVPLQPLVHFNNSTISLQYNPISLSEILYCSASNYIACLPISLSEVLDFRF